MDEEDERFVHIKNDPRFRRIPKQERKIKIDKRFNAMFSDNRFKLHYAMDKRGRPIQSSTSEDLKKFYEVDSSESDREAQDIKEHKGKSSFSETKHIPKEQRNKPKEKKKNTNKSNTDARFNFGGNDEDSGNDSLVDETEDKLMDTILRTEESSNSSDDEDDDDDDKDNEAEESHIDLARGEGNVETSSSEDSSEDEEEDRFDHNWDEMDKAVKRSEDVSNRLAVCNMDWDRIKAEDLYVLFNNFKPSGGIINSVKIYPSEFGIQRMQEEEVKGPAELTNGTLASDEEDFTESREGSKYHMETLRKYQLNRLRYYYAVIECDSMDTSTALYNELDGMEYESSASRLDLRFVPEEEVFNQEPKSVCEKLPDMSTYTPVLFTTKALQQTAVELTWDENNPDRLKAIEKAFKEDTDDLNDDLRAYLASSSSSSSEDEKHDASDTEETVAADKGNKIAKYKELLASIAEEEEKKKNKDIEMEITWEPGLKDRAESLIQKKQQEEEMTYFQKYMQKKKETKKQRLKEKKEAESTHKDDGKGLCDDDDNEIPSDVDLNDPYFQEEMQNIKGQKSKKKERRKKDKLEETKEDKKSKAELELLLMDEKEDGKKHFNLKNLMEDATESKRKKKLKNKIQQTKAEDDFQINTGDPRFSALFSSADYNIDPSDTHFKKTKAMDALLQEKQKRRMERKVQTSDATSEGTKETVKRKLDPSLSFLVKSVKNKTQNFKRRRH